MKNKKSLLILFQFGFGYLKNIRNQNFLEIANIL